MCQTAQTRSSQVKDFSMDLAQPPDPRPPASAIVARIDASRTVVREAISRLKQSQTEPHWLYDN